MGCSWNEVNVRNPLFLLLLYCPLFLLVLLDTFVESSLHKIELFLPNALTWMTYFLWFCRMTCRVEWLWVIVILNIWQGVRVVLQDKTMRKRSVLTFNLLKKNSHLGVSSILGTTNNHQCSFPRTYHLTDFLWLTYESTRSSNLLLLQYIIWLRLHLSIQPVWTSCCYMHSWLNYIV